MNQKLIFTNKGLKEGSPTENFQELNSAVRKLIKRYRRSFIAKEEEEITTIHVDEIASKIAKLYEIIRRVIDWKEENVLRRSAIERILKRNLVSEISKVSFISHNGSENIAEILIKELIRGGHLPNDSVPSAKIPLVQKIIEKYLYLLKNALYPQNLLAFPLKRKVNFYNWLLALSACEIEETLAFPQKEIALIEAMTILMNERIKVLPENKMSEKEKFIQVYIAVHKTLFDVDDSLITYRLLIYQFPQWQEPDDISLKEFSQNIFKIWELFKKQLQSPVRKDFFNVCEKTDTIFMILGDILNSLKKRPEKFEQIFSSKKTLTKLIIKFYNRRLATLKSRLFRLAVYSSLSVFFSNFFTYFIVEVPLAKLFYEGFSFFAATIDFLIPTLVMFILVAMIKPPRTENLNKVIEMTFKFVYSDQTKDIYEIKLEKKRNVLTNLILGFLYLSAGILILGITALVFYKAGIPTTSIILDTAMISLNVFAALIIRNKAKELTVEEKSTLGEFALDTLSVPVAKIGSFLANKWREYNIISVFLSAFVEIPFVTLVDFIEDWSEFIKERKAEIH